VYATANWVATTDLMTSIITKTIIVGIYPALLLWFGILERSTLTGFLRLETK
jgi:hypothetical protein